MSKATEKATMDFLVDSHDEARRLRADLARANERVARLEGLLDDFVKEGTPETATRDWPTAEDFANWVIEEARAALADAQDGGPAERGIKEGE